MQLIKGMLKWDYKDRFTTEDVLSSTFIADIRNEALEVNCQAFYIRFR